jgi:hypothetical protein
MSAHTGDRLFSGAPVRLAAEHDGELRTTATVVRPEDAAARVQHIRTQIRPAGVA